jgi:hypothetical protein
VKKDIWTQAKAFVFFESPVRMDLIDGVFNKTHNHYQQEFPNWTYAATRKKLIFEFWSRKVFVHFAIMFTAAIIGVVTFTTNKHIFLLSLFMGAVISFMVIATKIYWPAYFSDFLPKLDTVIEEKQKFRTAQLELNKCKRSQFTIPTLTIIYYVNCKVCGVSLLPANDASAELLNQLYGVDKDKIKQNLSRLYHLSHLSAKEKAEMHKGIDRAREFFVKLNHMSAPEILDQLELKLSRT